MGRIAAGLAEELDLVVQRLPVAGQDMGAADDDVDLPGTGLDGLLDLGDALGNGRLPGRKAGGDGGDRDAVFP